MAVLIPGMQGVLCTATWGSFPVVLWILGCLCHSFGKLSLLILCMWYFYKVFKCFPLLCELAISTVSVMVPYLCPVFNMWFEYGELLLLFLNACMCSLYLVRNVLPVCLMYVSGQSKHIIWQIPLSLYLSVRGCCFNIFCILILSYECYFYLGALPYYCDFLFFSAICQRGPFRFLLLWVRIRIFFVGPDVLWFCSYYVCCYVVCFIMFSSFTFSYLDTGYVFNLFTNCWYLLLYVSVGSRSRWIL
jgi:hypothetical protein